MSFRLLMVVALLLAGPSKARAQMSPISDDHCTFPIRKWKMTSASMYPTIPPDREFCVVCMAHELGESGVPADSLQLAVGSHDIRPGDIILVQLKELFGPRKNVTPRRVIGMPGDQIQLQGDVLQINGNLLNRRREADLTLTRDRISEQFQQWRETLADGTSYNVALTPRASMQNQETTNVVVVPEKRLYVLGDNRGNSVDSRLQRIGNIGFDDIVGVVADGNEELEDVVGRTTTMILLGQVKPR